MAGMQQHEGRPATTLSWTELHQELENAAIDYGAFLSNLEDLPASKHGMGQRISEIQAEITNRTNRAELRSPGTLAILEGIPL